MLSEWAALASNAMLWGSQWINYFVGNNKGKSQECKACVDVVVHILSDPFMTLVLIHGFGNDPLNNRTFFLDICF